MMSRLNNRQKHALGWLFAITYFSGVAAMIVCLILFVH
jgi:hypothetical protein